VGFQKLEGNPPRGGRRRSWGATSLATGVAKNPTVFVRSAAVSLPIEQVGENKEGGLVPNIPEKEEKRLA